MPDVRSGLDQADYHLIKEVPDADFSPERNKAIIEQTIKESEAFFKTLAKGDDRDIDHRADVLSRYSVYRFNKGNKSLEGYLGKAQYNKIIGEHLQEKLRIAEATNSITKNKDIQKGILI